MNLKFLLICSFLITTQANKADTEVGRDLCGLIDEAMDLWERLQEVVRICTESSTKQINILIETIRKRSTEIQTQSRHEIKLAEEVLQTDLTEIIQQASNLGIDISNCTNGQKEALIKIQQKVEQEMTSCVNTRVTQATTISTTIIKKISQMKTTVLELEKEIEKCGTGWTASLCLGRTVGEITKKIVDFPKEISSELIRATDLIQSLQVEVEVCGSGRADRVMVGGASVIFNVMECGEKIRCVK